MTTDLATIPQPILPMGVQAAADAMAQYQELTAKLLTPEDWQGIPGRNQSFVKRRGWAKLATFYGVSTELRHTEIDRDEHGQPVRARVIARATHPNGRYAEGDGACSVSEARFRTEKGRGNLEHDLPATAATRAVNRAISNLIGFGEVSAEEIDASASAAPALAWGPIATDEQENLAAARLARIAPDIDAGRFLLDMGVHFNGVPQACTQMISALYDRVTDAQTPRGPNPADVYPDPDPGAAHRYQGGD